MNDISVIHTDGTNYEEMGNPNNNIRIHLS